MVTVPQIRKHNGWTCYECQDSMVVYRPRRTVKEKDDQGRFTCVIVGGMDACPTCARKAEEEYMIHGTAL